MSVDAPAGTRRGSRRRGKISRLALHEERTAYLFIAPWVIGLVIFWIGPILASLLLSFTEWDIVAPSPTWVGLSNYQEMLRDRQFWQSLRVTLKYTVMSVPLYMVAGFGLSLLLNLKIRGMNFFRTTLFVPVVLSGVAVAILWVSLLNPDVGAVNWLLRSIGIAKPPRWLDSPTWAVPALVLVGLWGVGGGAIIYLSGLQNVPAQLYEAARVDGAGPWQRFRHVTWPMLTPTLLYVLLTSLIGAFQVFDVAWILGGSQGGVGSSLRFYLINLWNNAFRDGRMGYACALAWVLVVLASIVILVIFHTSGRWVYYEYDPGKVQS